MLTAKYQNSLMMLSFIKAILINESQLYNKKLKETSFKCYCLHIEIMTNDQAKNYLAMSVINFLHWFKYY